MRRAEKLYAGAVLCEAAALLACGVLAVVWLLRLQTGQWLRVLRWMVAASLSVSLVLIPAEAAALRFYRKRRVPKTKTAQTWAVRILLPKLPYIFAALWLLHALIHAAMAEKYGWRHGGDVYMFYSRPGSRILFPPAMGLEISKLLLDRNEE